MRRSSWLLPLVILVLALSVLSCQEAPGPAATPVERAQLKLADQTTTDDLAAAADPPNSCPGSGPDGNKAAPIICIDDSAFPVITIVEPTPDPSAPDKHPHLFTTKTAHWFTKSGTGTIAIVYDSQLLNPPAMKVGNGHTKAKAGNQTGSVKYSVVVVRGTETSNVVDPTIVIDTCC